jgi:hypothetical protein
MVVDVVFPGWIPWRRFAVAKDVPGVFAQIEEIRKMEWGTPRPLSLPPRPAPA